MDGILKGIVRLLHPHYVSNIILSISFFILKTTPPFCYLLFDDCELEMREWELLTFLGCVVVLKNRKQPSYLTYISTVCMFSKLLGVLLFFRQNTVMAIIYVVICILHLAFLPEPTYSGPQYITYFSDDNLEDEIKRDARVTWLICFFAAWQPTCVNFAPVFAEMSSKYALDNLKFGKLDVTRYPKIAERFRIDTSSWSKQLPSVILFQGGKETSRQPLIDSKGRIVGKFVFSEETVMKHFNITELHLQCKKNPIKKKKGKADLDAPAKPEVASNGKDKTE